MLYTLGASSEYHKGSLPLYRLAENYVLQQSIITTRIFLLFVGEVTAGGWVLETEKESIMSIINTDEKA